MRRASSCSSAGGDPPRDVAREIARRGSAVGAQGRAAAVAEPPDEQAAVARGGEQHHLVVPHEAGHGLGRARLHLPHGRDHGGAVRAAIDVVAEEHEPMRTPVRVAAHAVEQRAQEGVAAVDVADGVRERTAHGLTSPAAPRGARAGCKSGVQERGARAGQEDGRDRRPWLRAAARMRACGRRQPRRTSACGARLVVDRGQPRTGDPVLEVIGLRLERDAALLAAAAPDELLRVFALERGAGAVQPSELPDMDHLVRQADRRFQPIRPPGARHPIRTRHPGPAPDR